MGNSRNLRASALRGVCDHADFRRRVDVSSRRARARRTRENHEASNATFEGWAILEIFGHQRYAGYVTTQTFGAASMFRLDVPALEERERTTKPRTPPLKDGQF